MFWKHTCKYTSVTTYLGSNRDYGCGKSKLTISRMYRLYLCKCGKWKISGFPYDGIMTGKFYKDIKNPREKLIEIGEYISNDQNFPIEYNLKGWKKVKGKDEREQ